MNMRYKWYDARCHYCGRSIKVRIREDLYISNPDVLLGNACLKCVPANSPARDGCNESAFETKDLALSESTFETENLAQNENKPQYSDLLGRRASRNMKIKLDPGAYMPERAYEFDAGYDIRSCEDQIVPAKESATFNTGVHVEIPTGYVGFLKSKSGLNVKHGITSEGVIDAGFRGSIVVKLYNNSGFDYTVHKGDKMSQLVILPIITPELELVDELGETERGSKGFGSSGV